MSLFPPPSSQKLSLYIRPTYTSGHKATDTSDGAMAELKTWSFWKAVLAEFVGMLLFIVLGLTAIVGKVGHSGISQEVKVSLAFALAIATLAQSLGHVSGAHLNPAVTLGLLVSCQISFLRCICYILAQMLGAVAASAIVNSFAPGSSLGTNEVKRLFIRSHLAD